MRERYSIEVTDESVEIYGELTIEEAFDFLSFFDRKGYKSVILGTENSTLHLLKRDPEEARVDQRITDLRDEVVDYKRWLEKEQDAHKKTTDKLKDTEALMKSVMSEEYVKYKALYDENQKIIRAQMIMQLGQNPEVQKIMEDQFPDRTISRPMTQEEKDGAFNQLLNMKKNPQDIMPTIEEFMNDHRREDETKQ